MKTLRKVTLFGLLLTAFAIIAMVISVAITSGDRSPFARSIRWVKGESTIDQRANDLVKDIRTRPELKQLQPWALGVLESYEKGQLQTNSKTSFWRVENSTTLAPKEIPKFISDSWGFTNAGWALPEISVVLVENKPACVVIDFSSYGIAVGPPDYQLSFVADEANRISPGIFSYEFFE
jgi:hypothetical protein